MSHAFWKSSLSGTSTVVLVMFILFVFMISFMNNLSSSVSSSHIDVASGSSMLSLTHQGVKMGTNFSYWSIYLLMFVFGLIVIKAKL